LLGELDGAALEVADLHIGAAGAVAELLLRPSALLSPFANTIRQAFHAREVYDLSRHRVFALSPKYFGRDIAW
jgi:hypothetical protein